MKGCLTSLFITTITFISGCAIVDTQQIARSMYNVRETGTSAFDGTRFVRMRNIACSGDPVIRFDLYQDSRMAQTDNAVLTVKVAGAHSIANDKSLHFNLDGEYLNLSTADTTTEIEEVYAAQSTSGYAGGGTYVSPVYAPAINASTKRYPISEQAIETIARAKRVVVKVDLSRSYVEGVCSPPEVGLSKDNDWQNELSGTAGFKGFAEMTKALK